MYKVTSHALVPDTALENLLRAENAGSVIIHCAVVREVSGQAVTSSVSYSALPGAEEELEQIGDELKSRWHIENVALHRRTGRLAPGEIISVVGISAARSKDAFGACAEAVARLKEMKYIEKEEVFHGEGR